VCFHKENIGKGNNKKFMNKEQKNKTKKIFDFAASRVLFFMIGLFVSIAVVSVYAAWNDDVSPGDTITADGWNNIVAKLKELEATTVKSVKIIAHDDGYAGQSGTAACAAEGMICSRVISHNYVYKDPTHQHTNGVRICQGWYNRGLTGVEDGVSDLDNIHDCGALLGNYMTYYDQLECYGHFSAICY
jgi:hypothetical protein